ncbi:MAG: T9SS type A sorting domain-containing protein [Bacteroidia bacterium]
MKSVSLLLIVFLLCIKCSSQTLNIHSISHNRQSNGGQYTLDGSTMNNGARLKAMSLTNFGSSGVYPKSVNIIDGYSTSNSLTQVLNLPYNNIFFFGTFIKSDNTLIQFTNQEIDSLYNWSKKGGKLIICAGASEPPGGYDLSILNSKWGFQITQAPSVSFIPNSIGLTTDIFNGPFGSIDSATQGGTIQGYFNTLPSNVSVLATDYYNNPTLVLDCNTLDLILADIDGYTSSPGTVTTGNIVTNDQDKFWVNTIVFMDKLQGLPTISIDGTNLSVANIYNSYQWYKDGLAINGSTSNSIAVSEDGQYYVKVTVNGGCEVKSNTITADSTLGIKENTAINTIKVFPNPSNSTFTIQLSSQQALQLSVTDITGHTVYTNKNAAGNITVDATSFSAGVYFVKAVNEKTVLTGKFIKE